MSTTFKHSVVIFILCTLALPVFAASIGDSFTVGILVNDDFTPPSVPSPVTATPLAATQIDITWGASTDNTAVGGYQLFRDSVQIATTTLTTYSDTGLTASTTYSYTVVAFDTVNNFSSSSAPVSTTTFQIPPSVVATTTDDGQGGGGSATRPWPELRSLTVTPGTESASVNFTTNVPVRTVIRYGRTSAYDDGIIESSRYASTHATLITGLRPATSYEFELYGYDRFGREVLLTREFFTTLATPDTAPPLNVAGFTARAVGSDVLLSWDEPREPDYAYVRIVRNHLFFPTDPNDGVVVFEGRKEEFSDEAALRNYGTQYYSIFAYDSSGNRSSGAITLVRRVGYQPEPTSSTTTATTTTVTPAITVADIEVVQGGVAYQLSDSQFKLSPTEPFVLRIPYDRFPRHLKVITVTLSHPSDANQVFAFMLRANDDFTYYEAALAPLSTKGSYGLAVSVFDLKLEQIYDVTGTLNVGGAGRVDREQSGAGDVLWTVQAMFAVFFLLLLCLLLLLLYRRRTREDNGL